MYKVIIEPSIFRGYDTFELGCYRFKWYAWFKAHLHVANNPHAKAWVQKALQNA